MKRGKKNYFLKFKKKLKEGWEFLWEEDSLSSWIVSLLLAFIIVKFVFFPLASLLLATEMPLVVVESESMHHPGGFIGNTLGLEKNFNLWWEEKGGWYKNRRIKKEVALGWPFRTGLEAGDIILVRGDNSLEIGDVIIFNAEKKHPIIHRIIEKKRINNQTYYETKGDNNNKQLIIEKDIVMDDIIGKAIFRIPKLGWIKLIFIKIF